MAEGINVRFKGQLQRFIESRVGESGMYSSASEYIRDLVRHDFAEEEKRKLSVLHAELRAGLDADRAEFVEFDMEKIISRANEKYAD